MGGTIGSRWLRAAAVLALCASSYGCGGGDRGSSGSGGGPGPTPTPTFTPTPAPQSTWTPPKVLPPSGTRPNVLLIVLDDLRPDLGIYGNPVVQTPNIDELGRSGAVFENSFVSMAICAPSRTSMLTSLRPDTTKVYDLNHLIDQAVPGAVTLADLFRSAGYQTILAGKVFHHWWLDDDADGYTTRLGVQPEVLPGGSEFATSVARIADRSTLRDTKDVENAIKIFPQLAASKSPFFLAMGIFRPHLPFLAPASDWDKYTAAQIPKPVNPGGQTGAYPFSIETWEVWDYDDVAPYKPTIIDPKATELRWGYLAGITFADSLVGELMAALKANGLSDNTIVVLWGDNGYKLGDHGHWSKHSNSELDIRVPLIVSAPNRVPAGERIKGLVEAVDIYPTLAEMAGIQYGPQVEGMSFVPLFANPDRAWKEAAFAQYNRSHTETGGLGDLMGYTVRTKDYRYTAWVQIGTTNVVGRELYDLRTDPDETTNVAGKRDYSSTVNTLEQLRVNGWRTARDNVAP